MNKSMLNEMITVRDCYEEKKGQIVFVSHFLLSAFVVRLAARRWFAFPFILIVKLVL